MKKSVRLICLIILVPLFVKAQDVIQLEGDTSIFLQVPKMPTYGNYETEFLEFIQKESKIPTTLSRNNSTRPVFVNILIGKDGDVIFDSYAKGYNDDLNAEAKRIVEKMPNWEPGEFSDGRKARIKVTIPFWFK